MMNMAEATWLGCPVCHQKTRTKILPTTRLDHFPLYCRHCKKETLVRVEALKITPIIEPDAMTQSQ